MCSKQSQAADSMFQCLPCFFHCCQTQVSNLISLVCYSVSIKVMCYITKNQYKVQHPLRKKDASKIGTRGHGSNVDFDRDQTGDMQMWPRLSSIYHSYEETICHESQNISNNPDAHLMSWTSNCQGSMLCSGQVRNTIRG